MPKKTLLPYLGGIIVLILLISTMQALAEVPQVVLLPITLKGAPVKPGGQIVFVSARTGNLDLFRMDYDGSALLQLTDTAYAEIDPDWSPDGSQIAYSSEKTGTWEIYVMESEGSNPVQLTTLGSSYAPQWSPDGSQIAFSREQDGISQIYVMHSDGSELHPITDPTIHVNSPYWSPDGLRLAYITNDADPPGVYAIDLDGNPTELLFADTARSVAWSPDGRWLALSLYLDPVSHTTDVALFDLQFGLITRLTFSTVDHLDVDWFPLGNYLIFWADYSTPTNADVYTLTRTGTQLQNLTNYPGNDMMGDWTP